MEQIDEFIRSLGISDPIIAYIIAGVLLIISLVFIRKVFKVMIWLTVALVLYFCFVLATGNELNVDLPKDISIKEIIDFGTSLANAFITFLKSMLHDIAGLVSGAPLDNTLDKAGSTVEKAVQ